MIMIDGLSSLSLGAHKHNQRRYQQMLCKPRVTDWLEKIHMWYKTGLCWHDLIYQYTFARVFLFQFAYGSNFLSFFYQGWTWAKSNLHATQSGGSFWHSIIHLGRKPLLAKPKRIWYGRWYIQWFWLNNYFWSGDNALVLSKSCDLSNERPLPTSFLQSSGVLGMLKNWVDQVFGSCGCRNWALRLLGDFLCAEDHWG